MKEGTKIKLLWGATALCAVLSVMSFRYGVKHRKEEAKHADDADVYTNGSSFITVAPPTCHHLLSLTNINPDEVWTVDLGSLRLSPVVEVRVSVEVCKVCGALLAWDEVGSNSFRRGLNVPRLLPPWGYPYRLRQCRDVKFDRIVFTNDVLIHYAPEGCPAWADPEAPIGRNALVEAPEPARSTFLPGLFTNQYLWASNRIISLNDALTMRFTNDVLTNLGNSVHQQEQQQKGKQ
jgi:hypothetical protein